jgi:hypothetical protein
MLPHDVWERVLLYSEWMDRPPLMLGCKQLLSQCLNTPCFDAFALANPADASMLSHRAVMDCRSFVHVSVIADACTKRCKSHATTLELRRSSLWSLRDLDCLVKDVLPCFPLLRSLTIYWSSSSNAATQQTSVSFSSTLCPQLEHVGLVSRDAELPVDLLLFLSNIAESCTALSFVRRLGPNDRFLSSFSCQFPSLKHLFLTSISLDAFATSMPMLSSLEHLTIEDCTGSSLILPALCVFLTTASRLSTFIVSLCPRLVVGENLSMQWSLLLRACFECKSLLDCRITHCEIGDCALEALATTDAERNACLKVLSLSHNALSDRGISILSEVRFSHILVDATENFKVSLACREDVARSCPHIKL